MSDIEQGIVEELTWEHHLCCYQHATAVFPEEMARGTVVSLDVSLDSTQDSTQDGTQATSPDTQDGTQDTLPDIRNAILPEQLLWPLDQGDPDAALELSRFIIKMIQGLAMCIGAIFAGAYLATVIEGTSPKHMF